MFRTVNIETLNERESLKLEPTYKGAGIAVIHAKTGSYFINKYSPLPLEGRKTIQPGPERPLIFYDSN